MRSTRRVLRTETLPGYEQEIGRWLWAMEEVRGRTVRMVRELDQATLDWRGPGEQENSIGSLLYHIALVEMSWLFMDVLEQDFPAPVKADFPFSMADDARRLTHVPSVPAADHLGRLDRSRHVFLSVARELSAEEWGRPRRPDDTDYEVTPEWAVFHLVEHEAGHAFQIAALKRRARRFFGGGS